LFVHPTSILEQKRAKEEEDGWGFKWLSKGRARARKSATANQAECIPAQGGRLLPDKIGQSWTNNPQNMLIF